MSTKKTVTQAEINRDPLWRFSAYELLTMSGPKLRKLLYGPDGKQPLKGRIESFQRKIAEFRKAKK